MKRIKMADALDWLLCGRSSNLNVTLKRLKADNSPNQKNWEKLKLMQ